MGNYTDWDHLTGKYQDAAKISGGQPNAEQWYIGPAEDELNSRISQKYAVPIVTTPSMCPPAIADLATDIAYYKAIGVRAKNGKQLLDYIESRFTLIAAGNFQLYYPGGGVVPLVSQGGGWSNTSDFQSSFGMDDVTNWNVSSNWQQYSETARGGSSGV